MIWTVLWNCLVSIFQRRNRSDSYSLFSAWSCNGKNWGLKNCNPNFVFPKYQNQVSASVSFQIFQAVSSSFNNALKTTGNFSGGSMVDFLFEGQYVFEWWNGSRMILFYSDNINDVEITTQQNLFLMLTADGLAEWRRDLYMLQIFFFLFFIIFFIPGQIYFAVWINAKFPEKVLIQIFDVNTYKNVFTHTFELIYEHKWRLIFMGHWQLWQYTKKWIVISCYILFSTLGLLLFNESNLKLTVHKHSR